MFALQLHVISPKGYKFVREQFNKSLPHAGTLRKWYSNSDCNGRPGFILEALKTLQSLANSKKCEGKSFLVSLSFDEIWIRKHLQWLHEQKVFSGRITYGNLTADDELPIASEVLMFMVTCLESATSIPVAYYCITSLNAYEKRDILLEVLAKLYHIGVTVINISFDGHKTNPVLCELLGASLDVHNPIPYIIDPLSGNKIYLLFDPCHMLKLLRNALGDLNYIRDPARGKIEWTFFEKLERIRTKDNFITHRLTKRHIQYFRNRMNVRLASATFSQSVASSMRYLSSKFKSFEHSDATVFFIEMINKLFDSMNSKHTRKSFSDFKNPIDKNNASTIFEFYETAVSYLKGLKFNRKYCVDSRRKTGFVGFIINTYTIKGLFKEYVEPGHLNSLRVLYHSQDVLESFFSRIRYLGQWNDNPTIQQFQSAVRKLTFLSEITSSDFANCEDNLNLLKISSCPKVIVDEDEIVVSDEITFENAAFEATAYNNNGFVDATICTNEDVTIAFKAGEIERKIQNGRFECDLCVNVLNEDLKVEGNLVENAITQRPCVSTFIICKYTHSIFDIRSKKKTFNYKSILNSIWNSIQYDELFKHSNFTHDPYHKKCFVDYIIDEYVRIQGTLIAKNKTLELQQKMLRNQNRRAYLFAGQ